VFIDLPGILYAGNTRQIAGQRRFALGGALKLGQSDEYALRLDVGRSSMRRLWRRAQNTPIRHPRAARLPRAIDTKAKVPDMTR